MNTINLSLDLAKEIFDSVGSIPVDDVTIKLVISYLTFAQKLPHKSEDDKKWEILGRDDIPQVFADGTFIDAFLGAHRLKDLNKLAQTFIRESLDQLEGRDYTLRNVLQVMEDPPLDFECPFRIVEVEEKP